MTVPVWVESIILKFSKCTVLIGELALHFSLYSLLFCFAENVRRSVPVLFVWVTVCWTENVSSETVKSTVDYLNLIQFLYRSRILLQKLLNVWEITQRRSAFLFNISRHNYTKHFGWVGPSARPRNVKFRSSVNSAESCTRSGKQDAGFMHSDLILHLDFLNNKWSYAYGATAESCTTSDRLAVDFMLWHHTRRASRLEHMGIYIPYFYPSRGINLPGPTSCALRA